MYDLATFQSLTKLKPKGFRQTKAALNARGSKIKVIDNALGEYDKVKTGMDTAKKAAALSAVIAECGRWLKAKLGKQSESANDRRPIITTLATEAFNRLKTLGAVSGVDFYNLSKAMTTGRQVNYKAKSLASGYVNERLLYAKNKTNPISGSDVHVQQFNLQDGAPRGWNSDKLQAALRKNFAALSPQDFETIAMAGNQGKPAYVHFVRKGERADKLMVIYQGYQFDFEDVAGAAIDTLSDTDPFMYAMDTYGNLFISSPDGLAAKGLRWNHSSFAAGDEVICAGMIMIRQGVLKYVDNASGHYKPTAENLFQLLRVFDGEGVDLTHATVQISQPSATKGYMDIYTVGAAWFLQLPTILGTLTPKTIQA
jgi:hypothetical protein